MSKISRYRDLLIRLMPKGKLWQFYEGSTTYELTEGMAVELSRVDDRAAKLLNEMRPSKTVELLPEWEKEYGLPDNCTPLAPTFAERRTNLLAKYLAQGGQSADYFVALFAQQGVNITITEKEPSYVTLSIPAEIVGDSYKYVWFVEVPGFQATYLEAEGSADDFLGTVTSSTNVACLIDRYKPVHTLAVYNYGT